MNMQQYLIDKIDFIPEIKRLRHIKGLHYKLIFFCTDVYLELNRIC